jgi:hypothetical protein
MASSYGQNQTIPLQGDLDINIFEVALRPDFLICFFFFFAMAISFFVEIYVYHVTFLASIAIDISPILG